MHVMMREWQEEGETREEVLFTGPKELLDLVAGMLNRNPVSVDFYTYIPRPISEMSFEDALNLKEFLKREGIKISGH